MALGLGLALDEHRSVFGPSTASDLLGSLYFYLFAASFKSLKFFFVVVGCFNLIEWVRPPYRHHVDVFLMASNFLSTTRKVNIYF